MAEIILACAVLLGSVTSFMAAAGGLWLAARKLRSIEGKLDVGVAVVTDVQAQVTTINGRSLAQLGDATETRRIEAIPEADRTASEREHVAEVPNADTPGVVTQDQVAGISQ